MISQFIARYPATVTVLLLICSNIFMTIAWYGHLKNTKSPLIAAIIVSWAIALLEYCFQVPANRISYGALSLFQLKIVQEVITLVVFTVFAYFVFGQTLKWNYAVSYLFIVGAVFFAFKA
ncbi:MAG: DMT family protein [Candidatus Baltobacteraceae bacterium]